MDVFMNKLGIAEAYDEAKCAECGGQCCKNHSCICHPSDFGSTDEEIEANLAQALSSGDYVVDFWEGGCPSLLPGETGYWVCPAMGASEDEGQQLLNDLLGLGEQLFGPLNTPPEYDGVVVKRATAGRCVLLSESGCTLPREKRPMGGRTLMPRPGAKCIQQAGAEDENEKPFFAKEWHEKRDVLFRAVHTAKEALGVKK